MWLFFHLCGQGLEKWVGQKHTWVGGKFFLFFFMLKTKKLKVNSTSMGAFSLGRALSAFFIGFKRTPACWVFFICFVFSAAGSLFFVFAKTPLQLVASRLVTGLGAGSLSIMLSLITAASSERERTTATLSHYVYSNPLNYICYRYCTTLNNTKLYMLQILYYTKRY